MQKTYFQSSENKFSPFRKLFFIVQNIFFQHAEITRKLRMTYPKLTGWVFESDGEAIRN